MQISFKYIFCSLLLLTFLALSINGSYAQKRIVYNEPARNADSLEINEGILSTKKQKIIYKKYGKRVATIELSKPVMVAQAEQEERWGFYQFPSIGKASDGTLIVKWHMQEDSHKTYGKIGRRYTPMMSKDNGLSWEPQDKDYYAPAHGYNGFMRNGQLIQINTPQSKDIQYYKGFPKPVAIKGDRAYYTVSQLPEDLQGVYISIHGEGQKPQNIHASLNDPGLLRNSIGDLFPLVWWGEIKQLADQSLVAGIYPAVYLDNLGNVMPSSVSFYRSEDNGHSWDIVGRIPFCYDGIADVQGDKEYDEPTFEVLKDSTFICVMRTGSTSPMYKSFSYDRGKTWTKPLSFTPNGVNPKLRLLKNEVLVLASGRPGVQIRFSFDGTGNTWSEPIDMIPFMNKDDTYVRDVSCGYSSIIENDENSFFIVYSDFTTKNEQGQERKSIWFRKITVTKK